jgi:hypothetical protein
MDKEQTIKEKITGFEQELEDLKKKYGLNPVATLEFPQFKILPIEVELALKVLEKNEYKIMLTYKEE